MAKYLDKWKDLFPDTVGGTTRPSEAVSDQEEFNTNGFPQFIAQDPVNYALQNAFLKQFLSNDAWLWVKQQQANQALDKHKGDAQAHPNGISGNAASATKLRTPRALNLSGAVTADAATFDGTADVTINVKTLDASKLKGTTSVSTTGNAATATKLAAARTIALSGNASGSTTFDGSGNATINATVNESAHAATATKVVTNAASGASANIAEATMASNDLARIRVSGATNAGELALETADDGSEPIVARQYTGIYTTPVRTAKILDESGNTSFPGTVVAPKFTGALNGNAATATKLQTARALSLTGKAAGSATFDGSANAAINVTSVNADTASKLSTARKINITGNATGSGTFDGSGDVNISVTVNESKHAAVADVATKANDSAKLGGYPLTVGDRSYGTVPLVRTDGVMEVGKYIDWHATSGGTEDYSSRWTAETNGTVSVGTINGTLKGNADSATTAENANKLSSESGSNYLKINTTDDSWSVIGPNPGYWLKSIRTDVDAPPYSIGNYSTAIAFGGYDTKGIITHAYNSPDVKFAGGAGSTASWKFTIHGGRNNEFYDLNNFPTKTGGGASGTWPINISGTATKVIGMYTGNGGQQGPSFFGKERAGCLMSNQTINGHGEHKNWLYMDNYGSDDVGGATAIGVSRTETRAYIMSSNADRKQWDRTAELLSSANYNSFAPTKTGGGASGTWGISISGNANTASSVPWSGVTGKPGTYPPSAHNHDSAYPSVTGTRASGTWGISISGNAASATNADKVDGYHASDLLSKMQGVLPKTAAEVGQFRELVVNDSHQIKLPDGGTWAYFVYTYNSWNGDDSNNEHRTRTGAGIAAGGTVLHTDGSITSNTINAFKLSGTAGAGGADGADGNNIIVGGFCWRIA